MTKKLYFADVSLSRYKVMDEEICIVTIAQDETEVSFKISNADADLLLKAEKESVAKMEARDAARDKKRLKVAEDESA